MCFSKLTISVVRVFTTLAVFFEKICTLSCLIFRPLLFINSGLSSRPCNLAIAVPELGDCHRLVPQRSRQTHRHHSPTSSSNIRYVGQVKGHNPAAAASMTALPSDSAIDARLSEEQQAAQLAESTDIDNRVGMSDAGYETDSVGTVSTSLASSARDYVFENGRRYHKFREGSYNFPNDKSEQDREDMTHALVTSFCHRLHFAPIGMNPQNILDIGTGTGIWGIAMGDQYPTANILGVDLSPIQPSWVPPNVRFMVDDVESPWLYPRDHFDYIHSRHMVMAIRDWPKLMRQAWEHLKPGGWMEMQEIHHRPYCHDGSMSLDHPVAQYWGLVSDGLASLGVNSDATILLADMMRDAGFINVTTRIFHVPIGRWPKNKTLKAVGLYWRAILLDGAQAIALGPMIRGLRWRREQVEIQLVEARKGYTDERVQSYMLLHIIYGQKPEKGIATAVTD